MNLPTSFSRTLSVAALLLATTTAAGCGSADDDSPAVCSSVDSLKSSVAGLADIKLDQGALSELDSGLKQVQSDLKKVKADAGTEFDTEIDAVDSATSALRSGLDAAVDAPSLETVSAVGTSVQALGSSLKNLSDAVNSTC